MSTQMIGWLALAGALWTAGYAGACCFWPFTACRRCGGGGRRRSPSGKNWRPCRKCRGSGTRVRLGRRVWTKIGIVKDKAVG